MNLGRAIHKSYNRGFAYTYSFCSTGINEKRSSEMVLHRPKYKNNDINKMLLYNNKIKKKLSIIVKLFVKNILRFT